MTTTESADINTNLGEERNAFFARIRGALKHDHNSPPAEPAPAVDQSLARLVSAKDDLPTVFTDRAQAVGMTVHRTTAAALSDVLAKVLADLGATRGVVGWGEAGRAVNLSATVEKQSLDLIDWQSADDLAPQFDAQVGITDVHAALAETGTLICCADSEHSRGLSLVPAHHIAVVRASDILPDMIDYLQNLNHDSCTDLPSSIVFVTGPSKTSDIEGVLVTGVHGPGSVHVLLVEDA